MALFKNKYRVESTRLKNWDYTQTGCYFVTICTKNRKCYFGEIVDGKMKLSEIGKIAYENWIGIPDHFKNVELDEFVIMPNHLHAIIIIANVPSVETRHGSVETRHGVSLHVNNKFSQPISGSLSVTMNQFKASVKRLCNVKNYDFTWQRNYYEHIIRDDGELNRIRKYITDNPANWELDENNPVITN